MAVEAIEAALAVGEAEVADEALGDAVGLEPGERGIFGRGFEAVEEFKTAHAEVGVFGCAVVAQEALLEGGCGGKSVGVGCVVVAAEAKGALRGESGDGSCGDIEDVG